MLNSTFNAIFCHKVLAIGKVGVSEYVSDQQTVLGFSDMIIFFCSILKLIVKLLLKVWFSITFFFFFASKVWRQKVWFILVIQVSKIFYFSILRWEQVGQDQGSSSWMNLLRSLTWALCETMVVHVLHFVTSVAMWNILTVQRTGI